jgi:hypothetical protein
MILKIKLSTFIFFLILTTFARAQSDSLILKRNISALQNYSKKQVIEKIHMHLDRPYYGLGDTIWFKAYTVSGSYHQLSTLSGVMYAELINANDTVIQRLTLQLQSGIAAGDFILPYTYKSGAYRIRAYTNWMRNDSTYFYEQKLIIGGLQSQPDINNPKQNVHVNNEPYQQGASTNSDIQFFPEGGELVNGLRSKVAIKATNKFGQAIDVQGIITDVNGTEVTSFSTQHQGMGQFAFTPQPGKMYQAKISTANGSSHLLNLPAAKDAGFTLTINNNEDSVYVKVAANDLFYKNNSNTSFYLIAQSGGNYYYSAGSKLAGRPVFTTAIDKKRFPSGITQFTLFSQTGEPLCERLIFIQNDDCLKLRLTPSQQSNLTRGTVKINLNATNNAGKPVTGTFSVAVTDESMVPVDENAENTIFTDLMLTSELKGHIEDPNYYFINSNDKTRTDLDFLMLTQGYRRFEWKKILADSNQELTYRPQNDLSLSGTLKTPSHKPIPNGKVRLTSIKDHFVVDALSDVNGNFTFTNLNLADSTKIIINAKKANGGDNVKITIKQPLYPPVNKTNERIVNTDVPEPVLTALKKSYVASQQISLKNVIQLKEVDIKHKRNEFFEPAYSDNMKLSANLNRPGNANQVILADQLFGCVKLSECLRAVIMDVDFLPYSSIAPSLPYSRRKPPRFSGGAQPMAVFIDGLQVGAEVLDDINPNDVYSIEVLTSVTYLSIYGSNAANGALVITLKHGSDYNPALETIDGLITYNFNGYYKAREFYSPKYDVKNTPSSADQRRTIYWKPDIITGASGQSSFEYFNADGKGTYRVVIEGIDEDGNLGRQVLRYKVE